jgi:uncharacterized membrane protein
MYARLPAIDWMRGVVMVLMALDHVRYFFTNVQFAPEDIDRTSIALFLTRWVTHFCAPVFFLLAGTGAFLRGQRGSSDELRRYLISRGFLLIVLELTIVGFAWQFTPGYSFAGVIWALGWSMVVLGLVARLPAPVLLATSLVIITAHDFVHSIRIDSSVGLILFRVLHRGGMVQSGGFEYFVLYPLVPWLALMILGYATGEVWRWQPARRQKLLLLAGSMATIGFVVLRATNAWGNPQGMSPGYRPFEIGETWGLTVVSLLNVAKYPPSLQYVLMTIGPSLMVLALADRWIRAQPRFVSRVLITFGRVPLFFYVCHLYLIHLAALAVAVMTGQPHEWLGLNPLDSQRRAGYGYDLPIVWLLWIVVVALLYALCRWFDLRQRGRGGWRESAGNELAAVQTRGGTLP